ncbi:sodium-dependent transporter [Clostridium sp. Cult3]|uniref:sodium-dependent transporter n=1 Tax=Clostridium sp. Cult3 TaxID=2079004 RepID=UPI001F309B16|nr:sodium-dependent transporter [Clostridium sp. Cult3]
MNNTEFETKDNREQFKSRFGFIMAVAGSAVGLGNIWRFPYITGVHGGGAFVIIYLVSIFIIGATIALTEMAIGRHGGSDVVEAYGQYDKRFKIPGYLSMIAVTVLLSFYNIIGGWSIYYFIQTISGKLIGLSSAQVEATFGNFVVNSPQVAIFTILFLAVNTIIIMKGITEGIEKVSSIVMPALFVLLIVLVIRSVTLPGAKEGVIWYLKPDFSKVTGSTFVAAVGQAFFTLSLGSGAMATYASYLSKDESLPKATYSVVIADTFVALLAGLAILPAVFAFGVSPGEGPGLVFVTLPSVFGQMPFGALFAAIFFVFFFLAALTSSISMLEVSVTYLIEKKKIKRKKAVIIMSIVVILLGIPPLMSFGGWSHVEIFGLGLFDLYDYFVSNISMPLVGLAGALVISWVWDKQVAKDEITSNGKFEFGLFNVWYNLTKYVVPILLIFVFLTATGILKI